MLHQGPDVWENAKDRRRTRPIIDEIKAVRRLLTIGRTDNPLSVSAGWDEALQALDALEALYGQTTAASSQPTRFSGLTAADGDVYIAIVGIDRFSGLREELGEAIIDAVTAELCARIVSSTKVHLGRFNRSTIEFTFAGSSIEAAEATLQKLQQTLEQPIALPDRELSLDVTIGFAGRAAGSDDVEGMIDRAEQALAKGRSKHQKVQAFTQKDEIDRSQRLALMRDLRRAHDRDELYLVYQPKLDLRTLKVESAEALVRWRHPTLGLVPPDAFIGLAEESGEIRQLTAFVLRQALADRSTLADAGAPLLMNINISGDLLADETFAAWVLSVLGENGLGLGFEITETAVIANPAKALAHIQSFVDTGVKIAIDDYGSGLSSLSYLKQIPAHELKIDKAFVSGLTKSHLDPLLVRSTIDLAHALGMQVTAEGVDNERSLALLRVMGCDMAQGFHVSKPLEREGLLDFLLSFSAQKFVSKPQFPALRQR